MDLSVMKKKLNSYKKPNGIFRNVSGELLIELLRAWEAYTGPFEDFARQVGVRKSQLGPMIHKARKLAKDTEYVGGDFKEVKVGEAMAHGAGGRIELVWDNGKVIRFAEVEVLLDFLKKSA